MGICRGGRGGCRAGLIGMNTVGSCVRRGVSGVAKDRELRWMRDLLESA